MADTQVLMGDGSSKAIQDVVVGDEVLAWNQATGENEPRRVVETFVHEGVETWEVETADGQVVTSTAEHPFWVEGKGWTPVRELTEGDVLATADGPVGLVRVEATGETARVFNFHVDELHNYHVGGSQGAVRVHNDCYETFYRTMSPENFAHLQVHGRIPATAETFISTRLEYAAAYDGVTVELMARKGTLAALEKMGVRHRLPGSVEAGTERLNNLVSVDQLKQYGLKWTESGVAMFKSERNTLNIGLGRSGALDTLNDRLLSYKVVR